MAFVPLLVDRTSRPPLGTPLRSDGHWSVQGLVGAWGVNEGGGRTLINAVNCSPGSIGAPQTITEQGLISTSAINSGSLLGLFPWVLNNAPFTLFYSGKTGSPSTSINVLLGFGSGQGGVIWYTNTGGLVFKQTGHAQDRTTLPSGTVALGADLTTVATFDGVTRRLFLSGSLKATSITTGVYTTAANIQFGLGGTSGGSLPASGGVSFLGMIYDRELSYPQVQSLSANPWQIYEPETVWVETGGGGEIFSGVFITSIENLIQSGVGQIGCGGGMSANAGSAAYSMGGLEGKQGDLSISIANLLQFLSGKSGNTADIQSTIITLSFLLSGKSGNSANFNSQLLSLTQSLNGQHGVSAALVASIGNLSAMFGEQVVFQGTVSAVTATFVSSISGITGNIGQTLASISVASVISGITGNSGLVQGALNQISGQWIGNVGVSGSALMYVSTGTEMVGKLGVSASIASELNEIGAYLIEIVTGGKIDRIVISTKTGSAVILTATGKINITTN